MTRIGAATVLLLTGIVIGMFINVNFAAESSENKPGFLIVVDKTVDSEGLEPYVAAAGGAIAVEAFHRASDKQ